MLQSLLLQLHILLMGLLMYAILTYTVAVFFVLQLEGRCCAIAESMHWLDIELD